MPSNSDKTATNAASLLVSVAAARLAADSSSSLCSAFFLGKLAALTLCFHLKKKVLIGYVWLRLCLRLDLFKINEQDYWLEMSAMQLPYKFKGAFSRERNLTRTRPEFYSYVCKFFYKDFFKSILWSIRHETPSVSNKSVCGFLGRCASASNDTARLSLFVGLKHDVSSVSISPSVKYSQR